MDADTVSERARAWLALDDDPVTRAELTALIDGDAEELALRFDGRLEFGTAGLRGLQGAGPQRMNRVVVRQTSAGLADYLDATTADCRERGVVIGYDARKNSEIFATATAAVFLDRGFAVYLSEGVCPTPIAAFGVLDFGAAAGVVVTASHNPPAYNGYKVYWGNGAQIIPPHDEGIAAAIEATIIGEGALSIDLDAAAREGKLRRFGADLERRYRMKARRLMRQPDISQKQSITIAYTPLHGVGGGPVSRLLAENGFETVVVEPSQAEPDGAFPTVSFPNPEEKGAMDRVIALAERIDADLVLANDPDADRLAVAIPEGKSYRMLSGDQVGALLADYLMSDYDGVRKPLLVTTIVSSQLLGVMAAKLGAEYRETLTGFKWLADAGINTAASCEFVLGYEEALGYSVGELVRDKDGVSAALVFAELCAETVHSGQTLGGRLEAIYRKYGAFLTRQVSLVRDGASGQDEIAELMRSARKSPPPEIDGARVMRVVDLESGAGDLPPTNALIFRLASGARVIMRPSGTEPKLKCYYEVREEVGGTEEVSAALARAKTALEGLVRAHQESL